MSIHKKIHDTIRTIVALGSFPVIEYGTSPEPDGANGYRTIEAIGDETVFADSFEASPIQYTFKDADDNKLTTDLKTDVDVRRWVCLVSIRQIVDPEAFLKSFGRTIPNDETLGTPILYMRITSADVEVPPVEQPSSGTYLRLELEITAGPVVSG